MYNYVSVRVPVYIIMCQYECVSVSASVSVYTSMCISVSVYQCECHGVSVYNYVSEIECVSVRVCKCV